MSGTAGDRFRRLLEILPRIADATDVPVAELAATLGVAPRGSTFPLVASFVRCSPAPAGP